MAFELPEDLQKETGRNLTRDPLQAGPLSPPDAGVSGLSVFPIFEWRNLNIFVKTLPYHQDSA
jgi:hypothetical protein